MPREVKKQKKDVAAVGSKRPAAAAAPAKKKSKLYAAPEKIVEGTVLTDLSKTQWRIGKSIGIGGFGEIYSACRVGEKDYEFVVKCEPHSNGPLFVEMHFYMRNGKQDDIKRFQREHGLKYLGMPHMVGSGSSDINGIKHRFIVMPRYGTDVAHLLLDNGNCLPEGTVYRLALQMLDVYEYIHSCGFVHADLKSANILLGYNKTSGGDAQAYLVDFGLASHYTTKEFKPDPKKMHNGTIEYTSRDAHQGVPTRRADLEILGYNLIEWLGAQLPWVRDKLLATPVKVQKSKEEFMSDVNTALKILFTKGVPMAITEFMKYIAKLKYDDVPDYNKCRKIFEDALKTLKISNSGPLDFKLKATNKNVVNASKPSKAVNKVSSPKPIKAAVTSKPIKTINDKKSQPKGIIDLNSDSSSGEEVEASGDEFVEERLLARKSDSEKPTTSKNVKAVRKLVSPKKSPILRKIAKRSPIKLTSPTNMVKSVSPIVSPLRATVKKEKVSPKLLHRHKTLITPSPVQKRPKVTGTTPTPTSTQSSSVKKIASSTPSGSTLQATRSTPLSAKANINIRPAITISSGSKRNGKTVINDCLTPNMSSNKTYEFNFELDVSMDANVIVNVKRKKKAQQMSVTYTDSPSRQQRQNATNGTHLTDASGDTPVSRVKVRKIADDKEIVSDSPRTPIVTLKKSKRIKSPRY